jgi:chromosome segregation ATPase
MKPASDGSPAIEAGLEEDILMSTQPNQEIVPDDLKARVERTRSKLVLIGAYVTNLKARISSLEIEVGQMRGALGEANRRLDHLDTRVERLEWQVTIKPSSHD